MSIQSLKLSKPYSLLRLTRPRQWLKNLAVFSAPLFWGNLFEPRVFLHSVEAFIAFTLASSATYLMNDIVDVEKDKIHPIKFNRPIASGLVKEIEAGILAGILAVSSLLFSYIFLNKFFLLAVLAYLLIQVVYSLKLRNIIILDALTVASGFVIRVFSGTFAASVPISSWLILSVIGLSLLLAFGKRRSERTILEAKKIPLETRETLKHYPDNLLDSMISMFSTFSVVTYSLYAFQASQVNTSRIISENLPATLSNPKWLLLTVPIVIYGIARYLYVIYEKKEGESPERALLTDQPLLNTIAIWVTCVIIIVYGLQG